MEKMFGKIGIPLAPYYRYIDSFDSKESLLTYLFDKVKSDTDTILCFENSMLFTDGSRGGHVCLLDYVNKAKEEVHLVDPSSRSPKWRTVKITKLYKAMQSHGVENMAGCWEIEKTK